MMSKEKSWIKVSFLIVLFLLPVAWEGFTQRCINLYNTSGEAVNVQNALKNTSFPNGMVKRSRETEMNGNLRSSDSVRPGDTLMLNLFSERFYKTVIDRIETDVNGAFLVRSRIPGNSFGFCLVSSRNGSSQLVVDIPEKNEFYRSWYNHNSGQSFILETDLSSGILPETEPPAIPPLPVQPGVEEDHPGNDVMSVSNLKTVRTEAEMVNHSTPDENQRDTLSALVVYTPAASAWAATAETDISHTISLMMARSQLVLDNSKLPLTLQLVHTAQIGYLERGIQDDLRFMTVKDDGVMDEVHLIRDAWCADLVILLECTEESAGTSWILTSAKGLPEYAFSVVSVQQASGSYAAIHEIGHNMGCHHHKQQNYQPGPGLFPYSAGWRWNGSDNRKYCTIMTYDKGTWFPDGVDAVRIPFFSDPGILYEGVAAGHSADADNARTIREIIPVITSYRGSCLQCVPPTVQAAGLISTVTGENSVTLEWKRGSGDAVLVVVGELPGNIRIPDRGIRYSPDRIFGKGAETGYGNYAVYNGQGTTATVTGLKSGTSYHINIYEYDSGSVCYLVPPLTGNFTTQGRPPESQVSGWEWQNPLPQGNPLCNVQMVNARDGWAVGECGTIIRTRDSGDTWALQKCGTHQALLDGCFTDTLNGTVVGNTGVILTTQDGGSTWILRYSGTVSALFGVSFPDRKNGIAVGASGTILRTTDGGVTWTRQTSGTTQPLLDVSCPGSGTGYAVGFSGTILKTTDGGFTWSKLPAVTGNRLTGVSFTSADTGTVIGTGGTILKTTDGGKNWIRQTSGTTADLVGVSFCDPKHGFAIGKAGNNLFLLKTSQGGNKWELHPIPSDSYLTGISFANPGQGTVVGGSSSGTGVASLIFTTRDSGVSWNLETEVATDRFLNDVVFTGSDNGIAVGEGGTIVTTMDGGIKWIRRESGSNASFCQIFPVDSVTWMTVGTDNRTSAGVLSRSDDHGLTWTTQSFLPAGIGSALTGVRFLSRTTGFMVGSVKSGTASETGTGEEPLVLKTDDGGTQWAQIPAGTQGKLTGIDFCTSERGFAPGNRKGTGSSSLFEGFILETSDGGKTWHVLLEDIGRELGKIRFANDKTGVILTSAPVIIVTGDGGKTWREQPTRVTDVQLKDIFMHDDRHWVATGTNGTVYITIDGGLSWEREESGTRLNLGAVFFIDANNGFVTGQGGTILRKSGEPCFYPLAAGPVTGPDHACQGSGNMLFSIDPVLHATGYNWSYSGTGIAIGNGESNAIDISFSQDATSGVLTVSGKSMCGSGAPSSHSVTVNPVSHTTEKVTICPGEEYHGITQPGTWHRNFRSSVGCDSTVITILSNHPGIDPGVVVRGDTLESVGLFPSFQWLDENGPVEGARDRRFIISRTGSYRLAVTDTNGCRQFSGIVDIVLTKSGQPERGDVLRCSIVPNPNNGRFAIHIGDSLKGIVNIRLMNPSGQLVSLKTVRSSGTTGQLEFDFSHLQKGIYLLVLSVGELQTCEKIVIL